MDGHKTYFPAQAFQNAHWEAFAQALGYADPSAYTGACRTAGGRREVRQRIAALAADDRGATISSHVVMAHKGEEGAGA